MTQLHAPTVEQFTVAYKALLDTHWIDNPADPTDHITGFIGQGETIWLPLTQAGIGPVWQQARLVDKTLRYVQFHDFTKLSSD
jgi:hypothetical protein